MARENVEAARDTAIAFIDKHGIVGWLLVLITFVLAVTIATSLYLANRLDQNADLIIKYAVREAESEKKTKQELLEIQRDSLRIREKGHLLLESNTRAMDDIRLSTELQTQLLLQLIAKTKETIVETERATQAIKDLDKKK